MSVKRLDNLEGFLPFTADRRGSLCSATLGDLVLDGQAILSVARQGSEHAEDAVLSPFMLTASGLVTTALSRLIAANFGLPEAALRPNDPMFSTTLRYGLPQDKVSVRLRYDAGPMRRQAAPLFDVVICNSTNEVRTTTNGEQIEGQGNLHQVPGVLSALREDLATIQTTHDICLPPRPVVPS